MEEASKMTQGAASMLHAVVGPPRTRVIPFYKPYLGQEEKEIVLHVLEQGALGGNGYFTSILRQTIKTLFGVQYVIAVTSASDALELAMMAFDVRPGDEVIMPSFTFVSTANAVIRQGGRPVFVDIEPDTWNIDPNAVERHITPSTRGIIPVHYAGQGCDMDRLMDIARAYNLWVVEDAAQAVGARYAGRYLGTWGDAGCYSFHITKNITCGEGGAFLTNNEVIARRAEIIAEKGTNRSAFLRGEVDKYTWVDLGSSFILSDMLAAIITEQLKKMDDINNRRIAIWERYHTELADLEVRGHIIRPVIRPKAQHNGHIYAFLCTDVGRRDAVLAGLKARGIDATFHYVPLHSSPYACNHGLYTEDLPVTDRVSASLVRLPLYPQLTADDQAYVIECVYDVFGDRL
jgi:dTDP-4-amino-4,6-dideoxygalactose transaminase